MPHSLRTRCIPVDSQCRDHRGQRLYQAFALHQYQLILAVRLGKCGLANPIAFEPILRASVRAVPNAWDSTFSSCNVGESIRQSVPLSSAVGASSPRRSGDSNVHAMARRSLSPDPAKSVWPMRPLLANVVSIVSMPGTSAGCSRFRRDCTTVEIPRFGRARSRFDAYSVMRSAMLTSGVYAINEVLAIHVRGGKDDIGRVEGSAQLSMQRLKSRE